MVWKYKTIKPKHIEVNGRRGLLGEFRIITLKVISIYSFREITCDDCFFMETDLGHLYIVFLIYFMCLLQGLSSRLLCQVVLNAEVRIKFIPLWSQNGYVIYSNENLYIKMLLRWNFISLYLLDYDKECINWLKDEHIMRNSWLSQNMDIAIAFTVAMKVLTNI